MRKLIFFLLIILHSLFSFSQPPKTYNSSEILLQLKKLNVLGSVLYVGAHPDDENNALLPYLANEKLYRTAYLSLTRGDGGQNLIGEEQGVELGLIRTQELLAARRIDGAEQFFTRAYEFGFSKSAVEALRIWDKDKILSDFVWVIREFQPDVIIKRFPPDARAGHGHHAASAILADEAFTAAADPNRFPEQFKYGVKPWQAKRIMWNTFNFGGTNTTSEDQLKIDIGGYNSLLGKSYGEMGGEARTMHKSQGEGRPRRRGQSFEYFATTAGTPAKTDLMDGIVYDWKRINGGEAIGIQVNNIISNYKPDQPVLSVQALVKLYQTVKALPISNWQQKKMGEVQQLVEACSGLYVEATSSQQKVVQGDSLRTNFVFIKRNNVDAVLKHISIENFDTSFSTALPVNQNITYNKTLASAENKKISQPYWLESPLVGGTFEVHDQLQIGKPQNDPSFEATILINIAGEDFLIKRPVQYRVIDPVKGDTYEPIPVLPKVELMYDKENYLSVGNNAVNSFINLKSNADLFRSQEISQRFSNKWTLQNTPANNDLNKFGSIFIPVSKESNYTEEITAVAKKGNVSYDGYTKTISYDHIPTITYFPRAKANLVKLDIKTVGKKIGYIIGAGDKVPQALQDMGYDVKTLSEADLNDNYLKLFDAIIVGIRAYNIFEFLTSKNDVLMRYVQNGGNMIVQYLKSNQVGNRKIVVGPYPFIIDAGSRVTEENAVVNFLLPNHPALNYPNKITAKDFEGWVQERSTYQALQLDTHYETPLGMNDKGEPQSNGSLAIAKYGKGNFVYASLVFFRELPAGIPGAYRLLANLIALGK
ncbi:MAG: PIG-L family deacetylase [Chitinophagaceae bacterium]|nr:PIG-L family deacetylase [Chitinophagaceae bacterium]